MSKLDINPRPERANSALVTKGALSAFRLIMGYILACFTAGATFALALLAIVATAPLVDSGNNPVGLEDLDAIGLIGVVGSLVALVYALPVAVIALIIFKYLLTETRLSFFLLGICCAFSTEMLFAFLTLKYSDFVEQIQSVVFLYVLLPLIPAGFGGTYVFGAIGMGYGFRNWPLKWW